MVPCPRGLVQTASSSRYIGQPFDPVVCTWLMKHTVQNMQLKTGHSMLSMAMACTRPGQRTLCMGMQAASWKVQRAAVLIMNKTSAHSMRSVGMTSL